MKKAIFPFSLILKRLAIGLLSLLIIAFLLFLYISPGTTPPIVDADGHTKPNSIAIVEQPVIGGVAQNLVIRGEHINNPVLLFVHGGPGMSTLAFIKDQFKGMEKLFTICYWEQRGAGRSYSGNIPPESMTLDQLINDGAEVSRYLLKKFNKQKIYIMGHSWGSLLASFMIHEHPELYEAYMGIGQVANTFLSEQKTHQFLMEEAQRRHDQKTADQLQQLKMPAPEASGRDWYDYFMVQRKIVFKYGGARYGTERKVSDMAKSVILCREYRMADKINYRAGITFSMLHLVTYLMTKNPATLLTEQKIPVYIFQGIHDRQTDFEVAKDYFDQLKAPLKKFYAFEHSAHAPHQEEYAAFEKIIRTDVLGKGE
jgi:pimeloyl-ACP methyl ester carboxylesterase